MTTTTEERLQYWMQQLKDGDGLPTLGDLDEILEHLNSLGNVLDGYAASAASVASAHGDRISIPFPIEAEHLAALGLIVAHVREGMDELKSYVDRIEEYMTVIDEARQAQKADDA